MAEWRMQPPSCGHDVSWGLAKCHEHGMLRPPFRCVQAWVTDEVGMCVFSGAVADVRLPNGEYIWAEYLLPFIDPGWYGSDIDRSAEVFERYLQWLRESRATTV
jgi:hypothetical protein